jgi:hypothetical protein
VHVHAHLLGRVGLLAQRLQLGALLLQLGLEPLAQQLGLLRTHRSSASFLSNQKALKTCCLHHRRTCSATLHASSFSATCACMTMVETLCFLHACMRAHLCLRIAQRILQRLAPRLALLQLGGHAGRLVVCPL